MSEQLFTLVPFDENETNSKLKIEGEIARQENILAVVYRLVGDLNNIVIPLSNSSPTRHHELWQNTCFEFFLGLKDSPKYWEFNLSPAGDWNIYCFKNYRQGMAEAKEFNALPFIVARRSPCLKLKLTLDLSPIIAAEQDLAVGITTVIKFKTGVLSYWALTHSTSEADFHHQDNFVIHL